MEKQKLMQGISSVVSKHAATSSQNKTKLINEISNTLDADLSKDSFVKVAQIIKRNVTISSNATAELINKIQPLFDDIKIKTENKAVLKPKEPKKEKVKDEAKKPKEKNKKKLSKKK